MDIKRNTLALFAASMLFAAGCSSDETNEPNVQVIEDTDVISPANARTYMADANATNETVALFYNLKTLSKTKYLIGQQDAFNSFYANAGGNSDIKKATGSDPALLGLDFMFITDDRNDGTEYNHWWHEQELQIVADAKQAYNKGMVTTFSWHLREPFHGETFYAADMTAEEKATAFASILPGGSNHNYFISKLDKVADVLNNLRGIDGKLVPVIFRPFHEFDGSWFWWGAAYATPDQYKQAYQFVVTYLRDTKNVHNVIYAFSPDNSYTSNVAYLSRYPGDAYVDVLGMDNYGDFSTGNASGTNLANAKLKMVSDLAKAKVKIAAFTETGFRVTSGTSAINGFFSTNIYNALTANNVEVAYVMFWANDQNGYYVSPSGTDFPAFAQKPESVLENTLPDMYSMPQ